MRPLLIGEAPARTTPAGFPPFFGMERSAKRLWDAGFRVSRTPESPVGNCDAINLIPEWPGAKWPAAQARSLALGLVLEGKLLSRKQVVLVGRRVARAFGVLDSIGWFEWFYLIEAHEKNGGPRFSTMPHPSGLNRWWDEPGAVEKARTFAKELLK